MNTCVIQQGAWPTREGMGGRHEAAVATSELLEQK